jgi:N-acetylglucosaminyl-diphospho-decaprenol L-rhamnosyltransferase
VNAASGPGVHVNAATELSVVVVTYSPGEALGTLLDSLPAATDRRYEVILADNGSTDGAPEAAASRESVRLLRTGGNLGYGGAVNAGAALSQAGWILVCNPDVVLRPGSIDALFDAERRWPRSGALGPLIYTAQGEIYPSARALPSLGRGIGHALLGWCWPSNPWTAAYRAERGEPVEDAVGWLSGACLLLRREAFDSVGGFDPAYFMYFEDVELGFQLAERGWQSVYAPTAVIVHTGGHATERNRPAMTAAHHASAYRYLARRYPGPRWLPVRLAVRIGLAVRLAASRLVPAVSAGARPARRRR